LPVSLIEHSALAFQPLPVYDPRTDELVRRQDRAPAATCDLALEVIVGSLEKGTMESVVNVLLAMFAQYAESTFGVRLPFPAERFAIDPLPEEPPIQAMIT
jgi:hypothetical protein